MALLLLPFSVQAEFLATPEDLRGRYVTGQGCSAPHPALEIDHEQLRLGRTSCFLRSVTRSGTSTTFDLTACWLGGEVSGDRTLVLNHLGGSRYDMSIELTRPLTRCPQH